MHSLLPKKLFTAHFLRILKKYSSFITMSWNCEVNKMFSKEVKEPAVLCWLPSSASDSSITWNRWFFVCSLSLVFLSMWPYPLRPNLNSSEVVPAFIEIGTLRYPLLHNPLEMKSCRFHEAGHVRIWLLSVLLVALRALCLTLSAIFPFFVACGCSSFCFLFLC